MVDAERAFAVKRMSPYGWLAMAAVTGAGAIGLEISYLTSTTRIGLFRGLVVLSEGASRGFDLAGALCFGIVAVLLGAIGIWLWRQRHNYDFVTLSPTGFWYPRDSGKKWVEYQSINMVLVEDNGRLLRVTTRDGHLHDVVRKKKLLVRADFDELVAVLREAVSAARRV
jgi:hypothetical protein